MQGKDIILGILSKKERSGYEINDILQNQLSYFYDGTYGMIYPTLRKLEKDGKILKEVVIQEGRPNKNIYAITESGKEEFDDYLQSEIDDETFKSDFLMRLFFGTSLDKAALKQLLKEEIARKEEKINRLNDNFKLWKNEGGLTSTQEITIKYGLAQYESTKKVLEDELVKLGGSLK
ncbi:PadR family transcriptional regulator [Streptococcus ratti]|uniref:PadR family transcriptional regulator n=1 Tax=Streptococcus ratti FA-1 = DSM 20564 TaxID=699248 RepID=A0ABP2R1Q1_STRRT|nr:PadR family transcriptional regulator [Streptococcus ratti]EJN94562.1 hypothetical protein SRA_08491 [Streptococcus ratti FA-1 = DSM 20564]EMP71284.1 hypothetical protein D822_01614 [Streptococcus ratti FA-1 = DSM 20564]QEY06493.1 PadR family transcriptional regulator [Streptococcus ratti]VEI60837.1 putative transcriptional regulator, PadR family [Streptococcus mutans]